MQLEFHHHHHHENYESKPKPFGKKRNEFGTNKRWWWWWWTSLLHLRMDSTFWSVCFNVFHSIRFNSPTTTPTHRIIYFIHVWIHTLGLVKFFFFFCPILLMQYTFTLVGLCGRYMSRRCCSSSSNGDDKLVNAIFQTSLNNNKWIIFYSNIRRLCHRCRRPVCRCRCRCRCQWRHQA